MKSWPIQPLGDVARVTAGNPAPQRPQDFCTNGIPFVRMQDVGRFGQTTSLTEVRDRLSVSASRKFKLFPAGSILVPKSGASIRLNHRAILRMEAHVVSHLAVIVPCEKVNSLFAYYWLCATDLSRITHHADLPSMKTSELAKLPIPVPPLAEQERIARLLDEADRLRKLRRHADRRTAELIPALFYEMFGLAKQFKPLKELADVVSGVAKGRKFNSEQPITVPYVRVANVQAGYLDLSELKTIEALPKEVKELSLKRGDVLLTEGGDFDKLGRGAMLDRDLPNCIHQNHVFRVRCDQSQMLPAYFASFLLTQDARLYFLRCAKKTSNLASINMTQLRALLIPVPPLPLQKQFAERVKEIRELESAQAQSRIRLDQLFASLLDNAFNGKL